MQAQSKSREKDLARVVSQVLGEPRNISVRSLFRPLNASDPFSGQEDWFIVEADYSGAELMVSAIMAQDAVMIDHCQRNLLPDDHPDFFDIHSNLTVQAFKFDCPPTKAGLEAIGKSHLRTVGKSIVFGSMYGRSAKAIAIAVRQEGVFVTVEECQTMQNAFFKEYADLAKFFDACRKRVSSHGWMRNMFGRYRRFPYTADENKRRGYEREAMNATIQGGVADAMSLACRNILDYRDHFGLRSELCLQIHDAVFMHVPASELLRVVDPDKGLLKRCMVDAVPLTPVNLDGDPLFSNETYKFGTSIDIYGHWGELPGADRFLRNGLSPTIVGWSEKDPGVWVHKYRNEAYHQGRGEYISLAG